MSVCFQRLFCIATCSLGHVFCPMSGDRKWSVSRRLKMCYSMVKSIGGHIEVCQL